MRVTAADVLGVRQAEFLKQAACLSASARPRRRATAPLLQLVHQPVRGLKAAAADCATKQTSLPRTLRNPWTQPLDVADF